MFDESYKFTDFNTYKAHTFNCMGGLCEVLIETKDFILSEKIFTVIYNEAKRIENKFSRYVDKNIIYKINSANGKKTHLDKETAKLIHYADQIYQVSNGLFDITSGALRRIWKFDQSENIPTQESINKILPFIGWEKVKLEKKALTLPKGFEIDLGGLGKEYAVDRAIALSKESYETAVLVNFGGDIAVTGPKAANTPWIINVEGSAKTYQLYSGGVATSGDLNKFLIFEGKKLPHILNPKTGRPIEGSPTSITVVSNSCTAAGTLSTLAFLQGADSESFLKDEADEYFIVL